MTPIRTQTGAQVNIVRTKPALRIHAALDAKAPKALLDREPSRSQDRDAAAKSPLRIENYRLNFETKTDVSGQPSRTGYSLPARGDAACDGSDLVREEAH